MHYSVKSNQVTQFVSFLWSNALLLKVTFPNTVVNKCNCYAMFQVSWMLYYLVWFLRQHLSHNDTSCDVNHVTEPFISPFCSRPVQSRHSNAKTLERWFCRTCCTRFCLTVFSFIFFYFLVLSSWLDGGTGVCESWYDVSSLRAWPDSAANCNLLFSPGRLQSASPRLCWMMC